MDTYDDESRLELNLDNRKLIIGFAGLMIVCAVFFVFGFVEGKRQAPKTESRAEGIAPPAPELKAASQPEAIPAGSNSASKPPEKAVAEQLDWYRKVNRRGTPSTRELSSIKPKQPAGPRRRSHTRSRLGRSASARKPKTGPQCSRLRDTSTSSSLRKTVQNSIS